MKIAVPTNDGINITRELPAKGFHVFTVELGEITGEELRWNKTNDNGANEDGPFNLVKDCSAILVNNSMTNGKSSGKQIIPVSGTIITRIIWDYLSDVIRKEANTCCCP
jgi:hypothetical protein